MARTKKQLIESQDIENLDEDSVSDNVDTSALEGMSKTNAMSVIMKQMAELEGDHWIDVFNAVQAQIGTHSAAIPNDAAAKNAASTAMKGAIKEDIASVFGSTELSEEFKNKATVLFESVVNTRVALIEAELQEQYEKSLSEELEQIQSELIEQLDDYLTVIVEQWAEENEVAIEKSVRAELAENFIQDLGQLFISHNYNIPEEQVEVVDLLSDKVDALEENLNVALLDNIEKDKVIEELTKSVILNDLSEGLTAVEAEKFVTLTEGFDIDDVDSYISKLETIKEHHFGKKTPKNNTQLITEEIEYTEEQVEAEERNTVSPQMKTYVDAIKKTRANY